MDPTKWKSVVISIATYKKLKELAHQNILKPKLTTLNYLKVKLYLHYLKTYMKIPYIIKNNLKY